MARPRLPPRICRVPRKPNWYIRDGDTLLSTSTESEAAAENELASYLAEKNTPPEHSTIGPILDARLADLKSSGKARAANTGVYHKALKAFFGVYRPAEITAPLVKQYWGKRKKRPASLREELLELRVALNWARKQGWIEAPPHIEVPERRPPRERFLSRKEAARIFEAAKSMHVRLFIALAIATGHRRGAILGLTWNRVDLKRGRVNFMDPERSETKKRRAIVPISKKVVAALRDAKRFAQTDNVIEYMGEPVTSIRTAWRDAADRAGLAWATPHILKHSVISWLAMEGKSAEKAADLTATNIQTVRRIYRHFDPEYLRDVAQNLVLGLDLANQFDKPPRRRKDPDKRKA